MGNCGKWRIVAAVAAAFLVLPHGAQAGDEQRNRTERAQDRRELRQDGRALADDRADLDRLSDLIANWSKARAAGDATAREQAEQRIAAELRGDLRENSARARGAQREVRRDRRELRSDRREVRSDRRQGRDAARNTARQGRELRDDRRDRRDDRRDLRDDRRDANRAADILAQKRALARELAQLQREGGDQAATQARKEGLFERYQELSRREIELGLRERREDRRELREDRRETREDRRQGR